MLRNIKLTIEYDGTDFQGWQSQKNLCRTVQVEIQKALTKLLKEEITLIGSGRTDSGVHAKGQIANFKTTSDKPIEEIKRAINPNLPEDISVSKVEEVPLNFHSQHSVKIKTYRYTILNREMRCSLTRNFAYFYPLKLNITAMKTETKNLVGKKDFRAFQCNNVTNRNMKDTTRTIKKIKISKKSDIITIDIVANGFLYKMARNIVGLLIDVGTGKLHKNTTKEILKLKNRGYRSKPAAACGLCLLDVKY